MVAPRQDQTKTRAFDSPAPTSNIAGMHEGVPATSKKADVSLVELESELEDLLLEYDELETAWPKGRHVLVRARTGRQAADALLRIADLQNAIATTPARTVPEAAVHLRRLAALFERWDNPLMRLLMPDNDDGETARRLLASALAVVEATDVPRTARQR